MDSLRPQYKRKALLERIQLSRATYYDQRKRMKHLQAMLSREGYSFCLETVHGSWGYLSCVTDEASGEVLTAKVSGSPNMHLIDDTI